MSIEIQRCTTLPPKEALNELLRDYYALILRRMAEMGVTVDADTPQSALDEFWKNAHNYLPPNGCLVIARRIDGSEMLGCGMLKQLDDSVGELKRLYVKPSARGTGTGRRLVQARVDAARQMGLRKLVVDTLTPNVEMRALYPKLGFEEVAEPIPTTTYLEQPKLRPHMHFFVRHLD